MERRNKTVRAYRTDGSGHTAGPDQGPLEYLYSVEDYDENGNLVSSKRLTCDGEVEEEVTNKYDEKGRIIAEEIYSALDDYRQKRSIEYDDISGTVTDSNFYEDGAADRIVTHFGEGDIVKKIEHYTDGTHADEVEMFVYDSHNLPSEHNVYDGGNALKMKEKNFYDADGRLTEKTISRDGEADQSIRIFYDEAGNAIREEQYKNGALVYAYLSEYDGHGNLLNRVTKQSNTVMRRTSYKYNAGGRCIDEDEENLMYKTASRIQREYDGDDLLVRETSLTDQYVIRFEYDFYK
jgi:antitoxin component YwqK of YwqJK toxin-antitoxin module